MFKKIKNIFIRELPQRPTRIDVNATINNLNESSSQLSRDEINSYKGKEIKLEENRKYILDQLITLTNNSTTAAKNY